jgi:hypothetical protein
MSKIAVFYPATLAVLLTFSAIAQTPSGNWANVGTIARTADVRIGRDSAKPLRGSFESVTDIAVIISTSPQPIGRPEIASVSVRKPGHRVRNTFIGIGIGLVAGVGLGVATASRCSSEICGIAAVGSVAAGGVLGIMVGGVAGVAWPTGGWREVYRR